MDRSSRSKADGQRRTAGCCTSCRFLLLRRAGSTAWRCKSCSQMSLSIPRLLWPAGASPRSSFAADRCLVEKAIGDPSLPPSRACCESLPRGEGKTFSDVTLRIPIVSEAPANSATSPTKSSSLSAGHGQASRSNGRTEKLIAVDRDLGSNARKPPIGNS
jgi:hypothetical protein